MKKKVVVFSGAGLDRESGVLTFRDSKDGLWNNYKVDEVATKEGWSKNREKVLQFYNERRRELPNVEPNDAHRALVRLEEGYRVLNVTQNVTDLLERAGASDIIHLHGELTKARGCYHKSEGFDTNYIVKEIGYNDINIGDKCEHTDSQLRPHVCWFGEWPYDTDRAYDEVPFADILIIVGTSLEISYTISMLGQLRHKVLSGECEVYYVDPNPSTHMEAYGIKPNYIRKVASEGLNELVDELLNREEIEKNVAN